MSKTTDPKKEARNILESFKKKYKKVCKEEKIEEALTMKLLGSHFIGTFLSVEVKKELLKLVGEEDLEMKLIFNFVSSLHMPIPQKKWFLGSSHSTDILPRQAGNEKMLSTFILKNGQLTARRDHHMSMFPHLNLAPFTLSLSDTCCDIKFYSEIRNFYIHTKVVDEKFVGKASDRINQTFFTEQEQKTLDFYTMRKEHKWNDHTLRLSSTGSITSDKGQLQIFVEGVKVKDEKIRQLDVKGDTAIILFESDFLAHGTIRKAKNGIVIDCYEMSGSYPTECFFISKNFKLVVTKAVFVEKVPPFRNPPNWGLFKHVLIFIERIHQGDPEFLYHAPSDLYEQTFGNDNDRITFLSMFCEDLYLFFYAHGKESFSPEYFLSAKEDFVCRTHTARYDGGYYNRAIECSENNGDCPHIREMLRLARQFVEAYENNEVISDRDAVAVNTLLHMMEYFAKVICRGYFDKGFVFWRDSILYNWYKVHDEVDQVLYSFLDVYEKVNDAHSIGASFECATRLNIEIFNNYKSSEVAFMKLLLARPDILFFGSMETYPPISIIKKFVVAYQNQLEGKTWEEEMVEEKKDDDDKKTKDEEEQKKNAESGKPNPKKESKKSEPHKRNNKSKKKSKK